MNYQPIFQSQWPIPWHGHRCTAGKYGILHAALLSYNPLVGGAGIIRMHEYGDPTLAHSGIEGGIDKRGCSHHRGLCLANQAKS